MAYAMVGDQARPKKEYIATANFYNSFFTYTAIAPTSGNLATTGKLTPVTGASTGNCPAGRILRELGSHLYPGVNPGLLPTDANYNVFATHGSHIFTKVYDAVTGLRGFIDANNSVFATYSNERPEEFVDAGEIDGTGRRGPSVYTSGNVTAAGQIRSSTVTSPATNSYSTGSASIPITIDPTVGQVQVQTFSITGGTNSFTITTAATPAAGSLVYLILKTDASHTTAASVAAGTNVKMNTVALGTVASKTFGLTLVSDGTNLVQVGGNVVATPGM